MPLHLSSPWTSGVRNAAARHPVALRVMAGIVSASLALSSWGTAQTISLGTAEGFAVLGGSTVTNTGPTVIRGELGVSPGTAITGFPPGSVVSGTIHSNDAPAALAHASASTAFRQLGLELATNNLTGQNLGGLTLTPGIYRFDTSAQLTGTLSLNTGGDANAPFHFQIGSDLTTATNSAVLLLNGGSGNIFWQIGTSATLGTDSSFAGTIIADQSITLNTRASLGGRALAINGAVTLDSNVINIPIPPVPPVVVPPVEPPIVVPPVDPPVVVPPVVVPPVVVPPVDPPVVVPPVEPPIVVPPVVDPPVVVPPVVVPPVVVAVPVPTIVLTGILVVNGSLAGDVIVAGGALLGGGTVIGDLTNFSVVQAGGSTSPGKLTIGGDFTQTAPGTLSIRIASPTDYDLLVIGGAAHLGGALDIAYGGGYNPEAGDSFTILTAGGGVSGKFSSFDGESIGGTILRLEVVYTSNSVILEVTQGSFADLGSDFSLTPNERAVAKALDNLAARDSDNRLIGELNTLQLSDLPSALSLLSVEDFAAIFTTGLAISQIQVGNLERRLVEVRQGATGFSDSGFAVTDSHGAQNYDGKSVVSADGKSSVSPDGKTSRAPDGKSSQDVVETAVEREHRWGFFISGTGQFGDLESTRSARGSSFTTGGVTVGTDYRVNRNLVLGAAIGYASTSSELSRGGSLDIDSGKGSLYATYYTGGFYVNGIVGGGYGSIDTKRRTIGGLARGQTNATDLNGLLGTGYDFHHGAFTWGPVASLQYTTVGIDGFTERGALGAVRIDAQSQDSLKSAVGVRASYRQRLGRMVLTPELRAQWQHEYLDDRSSIDARFSSRSAFTSHGPQIGRDSLLVDAGASLQLNSRVSIYGFYTGDLGRENYAVHSLNGGVRVSF